MDNNVIDNGMLLYLDFRKEIDKMAWPLMRDGMSKQIHWITQLGMNVGFLIVTRPFMDGRIQSLAESLYVIPTFRRKHLAEDAVLSFLREGGEITRVAILNNNKPALAFWKHLFNLKIVSRDPVETVYKTTLKAKWLKGLYDGDKDK